MLLATGATGVKQARYRRGPTRGSDALYAHAQYNTQPVGIEGPWHLLFNAWCNEFRRGFCTLVLSFCSVTVSAFSPKTHPISSSMSSGIDSSIISSRLANSVLLVYWVSYT